ncbi:MAG TPA: energy transducer TonB, partial [Gemmatimonadaceae bacterium]|nr:energy transducer TonB [Gemmatimonadaceae bacterium]
VPAASPPAHGDSEGETSSSSSSAGAAVDPSQPFSAEHVERQAYLAEGGVAPRYPHSLRAAGIEGQVTALFVVSEAGRVEPGTLRFTRSDNPLFEAAVKDALERMRFIPAEVGGRKVRQLVQMPFVFRLASTEKR